MIIWIDKVKEMLRDGKLPPGVPALKKKSGNVVEKINEYIRQTTI